MPPKPSREPELTADRDGNAPRQLNLTQRESEVLLRVQHGFENKTIAFELGVSEQSVKEYVSVLLRKFGVPNRAALAEAGSRLDVIGEPIDRSWFPQMFRAASVQIAVTRGPEHRYVVANEAFVRRVGRPVVGKTMREAFPELVDSPNHELADLVYRTGESVVGHEIAGVLDHGGGSEVIYADGVIQALRGEDGTIEGLVLFMIDVTEQVRSRSTEPERAKPRDRSRG